MLTEYQKNTYKQDGFVVIPKVISSKNLKAMQDELEKMD